MTAAARQQRRRERLRRGEAVYGVIATSDVFWALEVSGMLRDSDAGDRSKVSLALTAALAEWASEKISSRVTLIATGRPHHG